MKTLILFSIFAQISNSNANDTPWGIVEYIGLVIGLFMVYFCYKMLFDCIYNEPKGSKWIWVLIILSINIIGATIYYYQIKKPRDAKGGYL